jgi:glycine/D-amino acid oxidase-like deaminating enzyme
MAETYDAVVIGGGVTGASIAYHLALRGLGRILLLEREALCAGSTGVSVASLDMLAHHASAAELQVRSLHAFQNSHELYGDECGWVETGMALLVGPGAVEGLRAVAQTVNAAGGRMDLLTPAEFSALEPACACDDAALISWAPQGGYVDPVLLTNTLANAARRLGVTLRQGDPALALTREGERVTGLQTRAGTITTGTVVVATGPWTTRFLRESGLEVPLRPNRHSVAVMAGPAEAIPRISFLDGLNLIYARPESGGLTICGSLDESIGNDWVDVDDGCPTPAMDYGMWVGERMVARCPGLERGELRKGWSGMVTMSPDLQPLLGALPLEGLYCASGFSGQGMKIAPAVGEVMAGLIAGEAAAARLLHPLRPSRFAEGEPVPTARLFGTLG